MHLHAVDGTALYAWHRVGQRAPGEPARGVVFFHGNAETVADRVPLQDFLAAHGWDVVVVAYRGYPGSEGSPSEGGLRQDAHAAWDYAVDTLAIPRDHLVIHGKSLGGGVSAMLAEDVSPAALVME